MQKSKNVENYVDLALHSIREIWKPLLTQIEYIECINHYQFYGCISAIWLKILLAIHFENSQTYET